MSVNFSNSFREFSMKLGIFSKLYREITHFWPWIRLVPSNSIWHPVGVGVSIILHVPLLCRKAALTELCASSISIIIFNGLSQIWENRWIIFVCQRYKSLKCKHSVTDFDRWRSRAIARYAITAKYNYMICETVKYSIPIISTTMHRSWQTFAKMCIDAHVSCSPCQALVLSVRNVFVGVWVNILLRKAKVDDKYRVPLWARRTADKKILRLNIAINQQLRVDVFHTLNL